eukprot:9485509-Pyramimonas_sp.AAC.1
MLGSGGDASTPDPPLIADNGPVATPRPGLCGDLSPHTPVGSPWGYPEDPERTAGSCRADAAVTLPQGV